MVLSPDTLQIVTDRPGATSTLASVSLLVCPAHNGCLDWSGQIPAVHGRFLALLGWFRRLFNWFCNSGHY
jgi:hypothetical protein